MSIMTDEQMDALIGVLPDEADDEDVIQMLMTIVGNFADGPPDAAHIVRIFTEASLMELLAGDDGYFGPGGPHAQH